MDSYEDVDDFLEHFGVRGMRWGNRRSKVSGRKNTTFDKNSKNLSEKELHARIQRMELERHYRDLNTPQRSEGAAFAQQAVRASGMAALTAVAGAAAGFFVRRALEQRLGA